MRRQMMEIQADLRPRMKRLYESEPEERWIDEFGARCYDPSEAFCMGIYAEAQFGKPFTLALLLFAAKSLEEHPDWRAEDVDMVHIYGYAGDILYEMGRFAEAEERARKALSVSSRSDDRWTETVGLAASAKEAGHWCAAAEAFAWAAEHYSDANPKHMLFGQPAKETWPAERLRNEAEECARNAQEGEMLLNTASYPYNRSVVPPIRSYRRHKCSVCGYIQLAHPNSVITEAGLCGECHQNNVVGTARLQCDKHGDYLGWLTQSGEILGNCPSCMQRKGQRKGLFARFFSS